MNVNFHSTKVHCIINYRKEVELVDIGNRLRMARLRRNLTLAFVGEVLGKTEATVQRYESGNIKNFQAKGKETNLQKNMLWTEMFMIIFTGHTKAVSRLHLMTNRLRLI